MEVVGSDGVKKMEERVREVQKKISVKTVTNNPLAVFTAFFFVSQQQFLGTVIVQQYAG